jgi:PAS domain-containing protein
MFKKIKEYFCKLSNKVFPEINLLINKIEDNQRVLLKMECLLEEEKQKIEYELCFYKGFAQILIEESPDMVWLKDTEGKYIIANASIKEGLLLTDLPYGRNDVDIAKKAKEIWGENKHTFGQKCLNSDVKVLNTLKSERFLESGKVKGKMLYLEVFKFPFYVDGKLIGVGGIGRDLTDYVESYRKNGNIDDIFKKYEFEG